jgi:nitrile hydratase accessory protein
MTASPATVRAAAAALADAAPPMIDGEPVFAEPWEGRAYGLALDLVEQRGLEWSEFRDRLIVAIGEEPARPYYESWVVALERLASDQQLVTDHELAHERADMGSYRYDEDGVDIEVTPLAHDHLTLHAVLGSAVVAPTATQVELYRTFDGDRQLDCGVRSFDGAGQLIVRQPLPPDDWGPLRDRLLSFPATWPVEHRSSSHD